MAGAARLIHWAGEHQAPTVDSGSKAPGQSHAEHQPVSPALLSFQEGVEAKKWGMSLAGCLEKHLSGRCSLGIF